MFGKKKKKTNALKYDMTLDSMKNEQVKEKAFAYKLHKSFDASLSSRGK